MMHKIEGDECPRCGCTDNVEVKRTKRWGSPWIHLICNNCGKRWGHSYEEKRTAIEGIVRFVQELTGGAKCPRCGRHPVRVTSAPKDTLPRIRYHHCDSCDWTGKSVEK